MYSLFIDTHDIEIIIALYKDEKLLDSIIKKSTRHHSEYIMPTIRDIISNNGIEVKDLGQILVVNGPGSFTGVRLAVTIAKTLAYTLNIPIKTITSLEVIMVSSNCELPIIHDVKGIFGGLFKNGELVDNYFYMSNEEFEEYRIKHDYAIEEKYEIDFEKVYKYLENREPLNPHEVNPLYIKVIEALKND
ncbi:MAG: tRNA (adenosine(37)-N6)-threonylcarbamoyltransferase complex dimerization subunit type 1 TsaB [Bacilli bacterium]|nr:tRNA (adenosine(37)-N6)-threonylcarbamoyltransferase complex dimerization subunit type 1 TsaB [Bacilli bacterium]